jgi:superfamily II DNA or RNA helicase
MSSTATDATDARVVAPRASRPTRVEQKAPFVPCLFLERGTILVDRGEGFASNFIEVETAVLRVSFGYPAFEASASAPPSDHRRDLDAEARARRCLEGFGAVDVECLEDCVVSPGAEVDYILDVDADPDVLVSFGAQAVPRLRELGWKVDVASDYPCRVVQSRGWYASLGSSESDERDWFELELGVEVDGELVDLVPALVDLIERKGSLAGLIGSRRAATALPLGDGRYLAVPPDRLRTIVRVLAELYEIEGIPRGGPVRIPAMVPSYLEALEEALPGGASAWRGDVVARTRARALTRGLTSEDVETPSELRATLRPYQREGLAWLQTLRVCGAGGILADDMGLGKTLQTIAHIVAEKTSGRMDRPVLVVAPTSLVGNWKNEFQKFAPCLKVVVLHGPHRHRRHAELDDADVVITTYPLVIRDEDVFDARSFYLMVLDEAQTIKNVRSRAHQAVKAIDAEYRLCLSGTPVENNLEELWAQFDLLMPGLLGDAPRFRTAFRYPIERDGNVERLQALRERVGPYILRRLKDEVARDLPPKTHIVRPVQLSGDQRDLYESIRIAAHATVRKAVKKKGLAASTIDILGALMKLRQVCCDPRLVPVSAAREVETSAKFNLLFEMLPELLGQGRRILLFSQFTSMLSLIAEGLQQRAAQGLTDMGELPYVSLTGATNDRQAAVDAFQAGRTNIFLISLKAGGTGLNLTAADTVIHYDPWWNPAAQAQATDRAYRIGQKRPVFVYNLIAEGSVEERMLDLQRRKQALADGLLSNRDHGAIEFDEAEVEDLFAPLRQ